MFKKPEISIKVEPTPNMLVSPHSGARVQKKDKSAERKETKIIESSGQSNVPRLKGKTTSLTPEKPKQLTR